MPMNDVAVARLSNDELGYSDQRSRAWFEDNPLAELGAMHKYGIVGGIDSVPICPSYSFQLPRRTFRATFAERTRISLSVGMGIVVLTVVRSISDEMASPQLRSCGARMATSPTPTPVPFSWKFE
jgi:hypothetical protein